MKGSHSYDYLFFDNFLLLLLYILTQVLAFYTFSKLVSVGNVGKFGYFGVDAVLRQSESMAQDKLHLKCQNK